MELLESSLQEIFFFYDPIKSNLKYHQSKLRNESTYTCSAPHKNQVLKLFVIIFILYTLIVENVSSFVKNYIL